MWKRWSVILPIYGLTLFTVITVHSIRAAPEHSSSLVKDYYWWGTTRLDPDPLNKHPHGTAIVPRASAQACLGWYPAELWDESGIVDKALLITAIPPFVAEAPLLIASAKLGINQIPIFFVTMPILLFAWFYFLGWALDRLRYKRFLRSADAQ